MPRKFPLPAPLDKLKDSAFDAVKDPKGTSERLIGQAKGAATVGRHLAEGLASTIAEQVSTRTRGRRAADAPRAEPPVEPRPDSHATPSPGPRKVQGDPVAPHPATDAPSAEPVPTTEARTHARKATPADVAKKATKKSPAKKSPAKKTPAKKTAAKKTAETPPAQETAAPAPGAPGDKLPPRTTDDTAPPPPPQQVEPNPEATPPR